LCEHIEGEDLPTVQKHVTGHDSSEEKSREENIRDESPSEKEKDSE
jgi:hypothetical protein